MALDVEAVAAEAERLREFLEPRWLDWKAGRWSDAPASAHMCRVSSLFAAQALAEAVGGTWDVRGGWAELPADLRPDEEETLDIGSFPGGMRDASGAWQGHYWAYGYDLDDLDATGLIVDLTADQFGHAAVVVAHEDDPRYRENILPYDEAMGRHMDGSRMRCDIWLDRWRGERAAAPGL